MLGLIHDLGEVIIGDITPSDGIGKGEGPTSKICSLLI